MNRQVFYSKLIFNTLKQWQSNFSDDSVMRSIVDNNFPLREQTECIGWVTKIRDIETKYREDNELSAAFPYYSRCINLEMIEANIIGPMENMCPELKEDFYPTTTTKTIGDLLDLNQNEMKFLQFAHYMTDTTYPFDSILNKIVNYYSNKPMMLSKMLNIPIRECQSLVDGFLIKSGIVIPSKYPEGVFCLSETYEKIFDTPDITIDQIDDILFPKNISSDLSLDDYPHIEQDIERVSNIIQDGLRNKVRGTNIMFWGPAGTGKTALALTLAKHHGWDIKMVGDISETDTEEKSRAERLANLKIAMKLYANNPNAVLLFDEIEDLFKSDKNATFSKAFINRIIETTPIPIIWTTNSLEVVGSPVLRRMSYNIHCKTPDKNARRRIWQKYAEEFDFKIPNIRDLDRFDISPALIKNASRIAGLEGMDNISDVVKSLDTMVNYGDERRFDSTPSVVREYDVSCINADIDMVKFTHQITNTKTSAFALCLYGAPGTGKSEYARYLAAQMDKDVLFKRASDLVSPFLGMTERNIAQAFHDAKTEGAMLLIDEGDSFFQNRETARQSWEVSQVNEILSQMENHPEPFVITTNLMDNLDPAALRRFTFKVRFDYLKGNQAAMLFRSYYGVDAPTRIMRNDLLAPGDISCVKKQVSVMGLTDGEEIYKLIERECELKPNYRKSVGF